MMNVLYEESFGKDLKKIGKKPAITVVAKAELAQSYRAQPHIGLFNLFMNPSF